jgi:RHS repeat-associated protein
MITPRPHNALSSRSSTVSKSSAKYKQRKRAFRTLLHEPLEDRRVMAVASAPDQNLAWPSAPTPIYFGAARVTEGLSSDLVSIDGNGTFTIGENANNNAWRTTLTSQPLGSNVTALAAASGLLSGGADPDPFEDFVLQTPTQFKVLRSNGNASWSSVQTLLYAGTSNAATYPATQPISAMLGSDLITDFVFPLAQSNSIAILAGKSDGTLSTPVILPAGGNTPILVAAANMLGGPAIDIAVGHTDGTVTFLEGQTDGAFVLRNDLTLSSLVPAMRSMKTSDVDGDGVFEVTIVGGNQAVQLRSSADPLPEPPIRNGNFDQGLVGWTVNAIGQPSNATPGTVNALPGTAQFTENQSFLTSLSQSFVVPPNNQSIQFDLVALGLETANNGSVPDAFEVSLLDTSNQSLVPTHSSQSTAFVNFTPAVGYRAASGVTRSGTLITLDISSLTPGTTANLVFDLIGNPHGAISNGTRSTATIDRVRITPDVIRNDSFLVTTLPGPFQDARDLAIADVDGDGRSDIIITDLGLNQIVVLNALPPSTAIPTNWSREPIGLPAGFAPDRVTAGPFTSGDNIADLAVLSSAGMTVRSPLIADTTVPTVQLQSPGSSIILGTTQSAADVFGTVTLQFSEAMFLAAGATPGSINHLAAYQVYHLGANNSDDGGLGDDVAFSVTSVTYDSATNRVQLQLDNSALANAAIAAGSLYKIVVAGADQTIGVRDIAGNRIDGGQDFVATVALNRTPTLTPLSSQSIDEGVAFSLSQLLDHYSLNRVYDAIIDWGDSSQPTTLSGNNAFPTESFDANHTYTNDGSYILLVRIMEGAVEVARTSAVVSVRNAAPTIQNLAPISGNEGQSIAYTFTANDSGLSDTLLAYVDWGDGTLSTLPVASQLGSTRTFTTSHTFPDNRNYTVRVRVADELGGTESTVTAAIASVAPSFSVSNATAVVGIAFSLETIDISDPGFTSVPNSSVETLSATINWGDGSPTEVSPLTGFTEGSIGRLTTASLTAIHTFSTAGSYSVTVTVADDDGATTVRTLTVVVSPVSTPDAWLPILNFDRDGYGNVIPKGTIVAEQWANWGVHISSPNSNHPPMIFSSTNPTGDDFDLGSPNAAFGGPGIGSGGASGATENRFDLKNVLILSEDGDSSDPDDNSSGGSLVFDFDHNVMIDDVKLMDIDAHESALLKWFDRTGNLISQYVVPGAGTGNGLHVAAISARGVARLTVTLPGSGAVAEIVFCRDVLPSSAIQIVGNASTREASSYSLALQANGNVVDQWIVNWGNGSYTTYPGNATTASYTYADGPASTAIVAYGLSSSSHHVYASSELSVAIENVVPTLTISGAATINAGQTYTLGLSKSDPGTDTIKGWLVDWGDGSQFQAIVGNPTSVAHQYSHRGTFNIVAHAFDEDYTGPFHPASGSLIEIHARGNEGGETFNLLIDHVVVRSFTTTTAQQKFTFHTSAAVAPNQVKVQFTNDLWQPANNIDRNLIVDRLTINNRTFETEAADVYSTGTWKQADGVQPGFRFSEILTNNGFFHFDRDANDGTSVTVRARGDMGGEQFTLSIAGTVVGTYTVGTSYQNYTYRSSRIVTPGQVRVSFINDLWEPANNIDRNLYVDYMELSSGVSTQRYQTEDSSVYGTGLWVQGEGAVSGFRRMDWLASNGYFQYASTRENGPFATEWISNNLTLTVNGDDSQCLPNIDFDRAANGQSLSSGTRITNQFASLGLTISTLNSNRPAMIFNSAAPTGGDTDLGTPNQAYGGPGVGSGGASNNKPLKNVLIISEDNNSSNPDDNASGGTFVFTYASLTKIEEIHLLDIEETGNRVKLYGANNSLIKTVNVPSAGNNSFQIVRLEATGVLRMEVIFVGSGAIAAVIGCVGGPTIGPPSTKFFVADTNDKVYRYAQNNSGVGNFTVQSSVNARGIATNRDSNPLWVVSEEGSNDKVYVYDSSTELLLGSWTLTGISSPQGITTDGTNLWVVDSSTKRVSRFNNGAAKRSGSAAASTSFTLHSHNSSPTDLVTDGTHLYVVDDACDDVFVYNLTGSFVNRWVLPSANADPSGITINTRESNGIYVLDRVDKRVYRYTNRIMPTSNVTQSAASSFALSSGNTNPQGIADPGGHTQIGTVVNDGFVTPNTTIDWTFDATAGQNIYVNFQSMTNQRMNSQLIDPLGNILYTRSSLNRATGHDSGSRLVSTTGTYTLRLTSAETPSFQFKVWEIPAPDVQDVVLGQSMSGAIEVPGAEDHWNFTATANQRMYFDMTALANTSALANARVDIYAPNGAIVFSRIAFRANSFDGSFTTTTAGTYRVVVKADAGGSQLPTYSFSLTNVPADDIQTIGYRQLATGAIEAPGARDQWKFNGTAGDNIFIDYLTVDGGDLQTTLVSPSGVTIHNTFFSRESGLDVELVLPETGIYTFYQSASNDVANLYSYSFRIWDIPPEVPQNALLNTTVSGSLVPGQETTYLFQVDQPTDVLFDSIDTNGTSVINRIAFTLRHPNGSIILARNLQDQMLSLTTPGTYQVVVQKWDINDADTHGNYAFRIQDRATPTMGALDNLGTKFYVGFPRNFREVFNSAVPSFSLTITGPRATSGTVQIPGTNFYTSFDVTPGQTTRIELPSQVELYDSDVITNLGVLVTALDEVAVYGLNQLTLSTDGFTALPVDTLGRDYVSLGYSNTVNYVLGGGTFVAMVAATDNTQVTITPKIAVGTRAAGVPYTISLNAGQTYNLHASTPSGADLSGTFVTSTQPIAVFGGNTAANVPQGFTAADHLIEQMQPTNTWGNEFLTAPLATRLNGDTFRVLAQADDTQVSINGVQVATLARGAHYETVLTTASQITSNKPVLVAQYANGTQFDGVLADPFMMLIPPRQQFQRDYTLSTPATGFLASFANIVLPTSAIATIRHNGSAIPLGEFNPIAGTEHSFVRIPISVGTHNFNADVPFGVSIYGFNTRDSYGYFGGMQFAPLQQVSALNVTPASITVPLNSQHTVAAQVVDGSGVGIPGVRVSFSVQGISGSQNVERITNASGLATLIITSANTGLDTITAYAAGLTQVAAVQWQAANPTLTIDSPASGSSLAIGAHVLSGRARAGIPSGSIVEVLVNGRRADALDTSGQFFTTIDLSSGLQSYTVTAIDQLGQSVSEVIQITGLVDSTDPNDLSNFSDVTTSADIQYSGTTYHRANRQLSADLQVVNTSEFPLDGPIFVRFDRFTSSSISLANADADPEIRRVTDSSIASLATSAKADLRIDNPNEDRFAPEVTVLARGNRPPRFVSMPTTQIGAGSPYRYTAAAVDPDTGLYQQGSISYRLLTAPEGTTIDATTGQVSWTPAITDVGSHQLTIEAADGRGGSAVQSFSLAVLATMPNRPPVFTSSPNLGGAPGVVYRYQASARDLDGDTLSFALTSGPAGATMTTDGLLEWSDPNSGAHPIVISVSDTRGGSATQQYTLYVGGGVLTLVPTIVSHPPVLAYPNSLYQYSVAATNPFATTLTYSLLDAPSGMAINSSTGVIQWTPSAAQLGSTPIVRIEVRNNDGGLASQSYAVSVIAQPPVAPPRYVSSPVTFATVDSSYGYNADAVLSDGNNTPDTGLTYALLAGPTGLAIDGSTGLVAWTPASGDLGNYRVLISATDTQTGLLKAYQQYYLSVRNVNTPPTFTSTPIESLDAGAYYRYDARATDTEDAVRYSLVTLPNTPAPAMQIDPIGGAITWQPKLGDVGSHTVVVRATDERGAFTDQSFTLTVNPDTQPPQVDILIDNPIINMGESSTVSIAARDASTIVSISLQASNQTLPLDAFNRYTFSNAAPGLYRLLATAVDAAGNVGTAEATLRVINPDDTTPPEVIIDPSLPGSVITYLTDITGSVIANDLDNYEVAWSLAGANQWTTFYRSTSQVTNSTLATFDPTMLANDIYEICVTAQDSNGNIAMQTFELSIEGQAKIGNYRVSFTDLSIPLAGIPITIGRTYDTLDAPYSQDFGYGWTLDVATPRIRESVRVSASEAAGAGPLVANPFRMGTRVYINTPDGRRVGFTFAPEVTAGLLGAVWTPKFTADPGVDYRLEVPHTSLSQNSDGTFGIYLFGLPYNPDTYTLVSKDQMRFTYGQFDDMQLRSVSNRNNVTLTFDETGIHSSIGPEILWTRDAQGRITQIIDPEGRAIQYGYDTSGDLVSVTNPSNEVIRMTYMTNPAHFIQSITDARGIKVQEVTYTDDSRIEGMRDANGNSTTHEFDLENQIEVIGDRMGNDSIMRFDARGNITSVTDPLGNSVSAIYNSADRPISITDERGNETRIEYDSRNNVIKRVDAAGGIWLTSYTELNDILTKTDALGRQVSFSYDQLGNRLSIVDAGGATTVMENDEFGRIAKVIEANGFARFYQYQSHVSPTKITHADGTFQSYVFNQRGELLSVTNELGNNLLITRDGSGREIARTDSLGNRTEIVYDRGRIAQFIDALGRTTSYHYDDRGLLIREVNPLGAVKSTEYDANLRMTSLRDENGNLTSWEYDANGNRTKQIDAFGFGSQYVYDAARNLVQEIDSSGTSTSYSFDSLNRQIQTVYPDGASSHTEYDPIGNIVKTIGARGEITLFEYDANDQIFRIVDPMGGEYLAAWDSLGNLLSQTDPRGNTQSFAYDERNRLIESRDSQGFAVRFLYDAASRLSKRIDQLNSETTYNYDSRGLLTSLTSQDGGVARFEYDQVGNKTRQIDPLGRATEYSFDALDRMIASTDPRGFVTTFEYDAMSNPIRFTDASGNVTSWSYDALNRVTQRTDPLGGTEQFIYDNVALACGCVSATGRGHLSEYVDKNGRQTVFKYDSRNRNAEVIYRDSNNTQVDRIIKTYDASSNLIAISDNDSHLQFSYDLNNRLSTSSNSGTPGVRTTTLTNEYDAAGNRTSVSDSDGVGIQSTYDSRNLLVSRAWSSSNPASAPLAPARVSFDYNARGQVSSVRRFADLTGTNLVGQTVQTYDTVGRIDKLSHQSAVDAVLAEYDADWNIADELEAWATGGGRVDYSYDQTGQLVSADYSSSTVADEIYQYDASGNRTDSDIVTGANNRLLADDRFDYSYDAQGNTVQKLERATGNRRTFLYDHENRLVFTETRSSSGTVLSNVSYRFDALGRRISRVADADGAGPSASTTETFVYDGTDVWLEANGAGSVTVRYLHGDGVDDPIARYRTDQESLSAVGQGLAWYLTDHLGSVRAIAEGSGAIVDEITYDSFGNIVLETNPTWGDRIKFTGREWDGEAGLYYYRARMYDPASGRFVSADPIGFAAGDANLYRYVGNMPGVFTDPSGNMAVTEYSWNLNNVSRVGIAAAQGLAGYTFGYTCGLLRATTVEGLQGDEAEFHARRLGLMVGSIDFAAGMSLNLKGSIGSKIFGIGLFAAGALTLTLGEQLVTSAGHGSGGSGGLGSSPGAAASSICTAASAVGGFTVGRAIGNVATKFAQRCTTCITVTPFGPVIQSVEDLAEYGLRAARIRTGTNGKIAIIGRGMDEIKRMQAVLKEQGFDVEIFDSQIPRRMLQDFRDAIDSGVNPPGLKKLSLFELNRQWALKLRSEGYTVIDAGDPLGRFAETGWSVYYALEKSILFW